tara:strand:+ start:881 stop:1762 length:882 start_codon:yes stop_codon:yes gene_type:complete
MARKRLISPEIWTSEDFLHLSFKGRLLYIALLNLADDDGIFKYSLITIKASCFPADNVTQDEIMDQLVIMQNRKMLVANEDNTLLRFKKWKDWQRVPKPIPSKFTFIEKELDDSGSTTVGLPDNNGSTPVVVKPNRIERNRIEKNRKERKEVLHQIENQFDDYYNNYIVGRKKNKPLALKQWIKLTNEERTKAIEQLPHHVKYWQAQINNGSMTINHVPHPSTWLSAKSFNDSHDTLVITQSNKPKDKEAFNTTYHDNMVKQTKEHQEYMKRMKQQAATDEEKKEALRVRVKG